ncbi:MAG: hypothetical protein V1695_02400 [Candidatus Uhrbacteria bacterium]
MPKNKKPNTLKDIGKAHATYERMRREIIGRSNGALSKSKRAIFAMHRNDLKGASEHLKEALHIFKESEAKFKDWPALKYEGAYKAALEEYAEALLFEQFLKTGKFDLLEKRVMDHGTYLAALSDATGEVVRYAIREATAGRYDSVKVATSTVEKVIEFLLGLDLSGYLRTKFDQAKKNLRNLEQVM